MTFTRHATWITEVPKKEMTLKGPSHALLACLRTKANAIYIYILHKNTGHEADLHSHPYYKL